MKINNVHDARSKDGLLLSQSPSRKMKLTAWMTLVLQCLTPASFAWIPAVQAAENTTRQQATDIWRLKAGETPAQIAQQFNLTYAQLEALNQQAGLKQPLDALREGDEIAVPRPLAGTSKGS